MQSIADKTYTMTISRVPKADPPPHTHTHDIGKDTIAQSYGDPEFRYR
jgi:hypothetical protein